MCPGCAPWGGLSWLLDMGANPYLVDKAIAGGFGMPMGPFRCAFVWVCTYWAFSLVSADAA